MTELVGHKMVWHPCCRSTQDWCKQISCKLNSLCSISSAGILPRICLKWRTSVPTCECCRYLWCRDHIVKKQTFYHFRIYSTTRAIGFHIWYVARYNSNLVAVRSHGSISCMHAGTLGFWYMEIHAMIFSWSEAIDHYIEQIRTTLVSDKNHYWIFILVLDNFRMIITLYFTFL